ncbi:GntR family transcriptional repressor for pyruvate dehydrogenase complex [Desulfobaculum xiamenense]|uniref:GntR family transcriptional repressor for pyruvate dehydrogenase complex n=1 Tax=Desulfobaculum xiamenense TaxID=995050 RepID=A0A846QPB1_9BACT|nr:FadR/GntR family transcriptional regulator [Desulfobaculum xiamenense]NJB68143.1 GntR family transcriptional repressor for pyruvate dehydrogenase complex [Desulfobaculum xiamenense]
MGVKTLPSEVFRTVEAVSRASVYEAIVERISGLLASGELAPGDRLPPERRLAEVFGVSRSSVREAIRVLSEQGVLESRPGSGTYVAHNRRGEFIAGLADSIAAGRRRLREMLEVRLLLEPHMAGMAARNATGDDVAALRDILDAQRAEVATGGTGGSSDALFHERLSRMCGNALLAELTDRMRDVLDEVRDDGLVTAERSEASLAAHGRILDAVESGDVQGAQSAMRGHLERVCAMLFPDGDFA